MYYYPPIRTLIGVTLTLLATFDLATAGFLSWWFGHQMCDILYDDKLKVDAIGLYQGTTAGSDRFLLVTTGGHVWDLPRSVLNVHVYTGEVPEEEKTVHLVKEKWPALAAHYGNHSEKVSITDLDNHSQLTVATLPRGSPNVSSTMKKWKKPASDPEVLSL